MEYITINCTPSEDDWCCYLNIRETKPGRPYPSTIGHRIAIRVALPPDAPVEWVLRVLHTALVELVPTD